MNNNENIARIHVDIVVPDEAAEGEISVQLEGQMNALLNGLARLNAHFLEDMIKDLGKGAAMHLYSAVQINAMKMADIDPEKEIRSDALKTLAVLANIFCGDDAEKEPEEEAQQNESV